MTGDVLAVSVPAFLASLAASVAVLRYARRKQMLDLPSERSSHTTPTPRGGGLGLVLVVAGGAALLAWLDHLDPRLVAALVGGGAVVAAAGWLDDVRGLSAGARFVAHLAAAVWAVVWLGGMPSLTVGATALATGAGGAVLAVAAIVWAVNLYNFMDGIDGLAAGEAVVVGAAAAVLLAPRDPSLALLPALVAGAAAGFLPLNWQPARIFMGDVGSGFLGFTFATLALASENAGALPALVWLILLGAFFADATLTLARRMLRRERWYAAHRSHAYQRAVQSGWTHRQVTGAVLLATAVLAVPAAAAAAAPERLPPALLASAVLLGALYLIVERRRPMGRAAGAPRMEKPL